MRRVTLAQGSGGKETAELVKNLFLPRISLKRIKDGIGLDELDDGATIPLDHRFTLVTSIDSYTVNPPFFPGGNIGKLAATGSVNDVAVMGGKPIAVLDSIVVEEGFPVNKLEIIVESMNSVLKKLGVALLGGDLKVMPRDTLDGIIITTVCLGLAEKIIRDSGLKPGDKLIVSGPIAEHGATILALQLGMDASTLRSDCAPVVDIVQTALRSGEVHAAKDPTRGGLAMALNEMAEKSGVGIIVDEEAIPVREDVRAFCEMLGVDPLTLACEGRVVIGVSEDTCGAVLEALRENGFPEACIIGEAVEKEPGLVLLKTSVGGHRILEPPIGETLPRIC